MAPAHGDMMVWVDLETTGLNPVDDFILEVGFRLTSWDGGNEYSRFDSRVFNHGWQERLRHGDNRPALEIHMENGLFDELRSDTRYDILDLREAESELIDWLTYKDVPQGLSLAGSSNHLDRYFLLRHMPHAANHFGYRLVDVSAIRETMRVVNPQLSERFDEHFANRPKVHRPQPDIDASIEQWQWLIDNFLHI